MIEVDVSQTPAQAIQAALDGKSRAFLAQAARHATDFSGGVRAAVAASVSVEFAAGRLAESERRIATEIIDLLARDVVKAVRVALSEHLKHCSFLPQSIACTLARDVESVAIPMLQFSDVLSDEHLIEAIGTGSAAKQLAIASRAAVGSAVTDALIEAADQPVILRLLDNSGAEISERGFHTVIRQLGADPEVQIRVANRPSLPLSVTERLMSQVSDALRRRLVERHDFPKELADELASQGWERSVTDLILAHPDKAEHLAATLHRHGKLTATLLLRALCEGNRRFFEAGMAAAAGVSLENTGALVRDKGVLGLRNLYSRTGFPPYLLRAVRTAVSVVYGSEEAHDDDARADLSQRIVERLLSDYGEACPADLEYMLSVLSHRVGLSAAPEKPATATAPAKGAVFDA